MVGYFGKGVTDDVAIRADLEAKHIPVTTDDLTRAIERLRAAQQPAGKPPTVEQMQNAVEEPVSPPVTPAKQVTPPVTQPIQPTGQATEPTLAETIVAPKRGG